MQKPATKPDFSSFKGIEVLKRAQEFMPKFIQETDRMLTNPELLKQYQMDVKIIDQDQGFNPDQDPNHNIKFVRFAY